MEGETAGATWEGMGERAEDAAVGGRTTAAPQFRRTMLRRLRTKEGAKAGAEGSAKPLRMTGAGYQIREAPSGVQTRGVNDGKGFMFIDHLGNVCPSGFLQVAGGNVLTEPLAQISRESELFRSLRDPSALSGRCGRCEYADLCGGSRARAYGVTGSYLADDPLCTLAVRDAAEAPAAS